MSKTQDITIIPGKGRRFGGLQNLIKIILAVGFTAILLSACRQSTGDLQPTGTLTPTATASVTPTPPPDAVSPAQAAIEPTGEQVLATPTPAPTATPSTLDIAVDDIVERVGISDLNFFGLSGKNLVNLLISIILIVLGSIVGSVLVDGALWITRRTPGKYDDQIVELLSAQIKWLIGLSFLQYATARLVFLSAEFKQWIGLFYFSLFVIVISSMVWQLIGFLLEGPLEKAASPQNRGLLVTFTPLLRRTLELVVIIAGLAIVLRNIGFNLSALLAVLGLGGLAISLAAKETLEDMINGFIILVDRPFHVGDRIKIETMDTWGDVETIGPRTTRIRTIDNRLVIVPNSVIGRNQIENYTFPDPSIQMNVEVGIGYGTDIDQAAEIIKRAIHDIPDVMQTRPPVVIFNEFGDSAMIFRVLYWLKSYKDIRLKSEVHKAIYNALSEAEVDMPFPTYDVHVSYPEQQDRN